VRTSDRSSVVQGTCSSIKSTVDALSHVNGKHIVSTAHWLSYKKGRYLQGSEAVSHSRISTLREAAKTIFDCRPGRIK